MKKLFAALTAAAAFAGLPAFAAPADPQAVKAMLEAMQVRQAMASSFADMEKAMPAMMRAQVAGAIEADPGLSPAKKQEALARAEKMLPGVAQAVSRVFRDPTLIDEMVAGMVPLYANNFTTAEIRELTAFYRTPLGRKMAVTMPKLSADSMALGQKLITPRLGKLMQDVMKDAQQP